MADPKPTQVKRAVVALLSSIAGDGGETYWYTPDRVYRFNTYNDPRLVDASVAKKQGGPAVIYGVSSSAGDGGAGVREGATSQVGVTLALVILALHSVDASIAPEDQDEIADRMERDITKALLSNVTLANLLTPSSGALVFNVTDEQGIRSEAFDALPAGKWIVRELRTNVVVGDIPLSDL